eukprot:COSAG02_NODE_65893_length_257_cov_0.506329_1_plen_53_part_10
MEHLEKLTQLTQRSVEKTGVTRSLDELAPPTPPRRLSLENTGVTGSVEQLPSL